MIPSQADKAIRRLKSAKYFYEKMKAPLTCCRMEDDKLEYTQAQKEKMRLALGKLWEAEKLVNEVYSEIIGNLIVQVL